MKKMAYILVGIMVLASLLVLACGSPATSPAPSSAAPKASSAPVSSAPVSSAPAKPTSSAPASTAPAKPSASAPASTASAASKYGGIIQLAIAAGPTGTLGYMPEAANSAYSYSKPALEPLVRLTMNGTVLPLLATSWEVDPSAKTMVFHLRKGVKFHDGSDLTASVVKWNYELMMAAKKAPNFESVVAVDDYTIKITVKNYQNTDLTGMYSGAFNIISKASFDKNGLEYTRTHPVGTGPFKFVEYINDSKLSYTKNPNYWDTGKPYLDGVVYNIVAEETVRKLMFQRGDLHIFFAGGITAQELQKAGTIMKTQPGGCYGIVPDSANPASPFSKLAVRQAVSYAIDREALAAGLGFGALKPGYQMYGSWEVAAIPGLQKTPFDPAKAKQLLKDAGYPNGFKTSIHLSPGVFTTDMATVLAKMMSEVGIQTDADPVTAGKYEEYRTQGWTNSLIGTAFINSANFNSTFNIYFPETGILYPSMKKPEGLQAAIKASLTSPQVDPVKIRAALKLINDDLAVIPFAEQVQTQFYNKGVNDPGADDYAFLPPLYGEFWLDASARK